MSITTGKPQWLKDIEEARKPVTICGIEYRQRDIGTRQCLIVRDYVDLIDCADCYNELLCMSADGLVFVDLGAAPIGHDLVINPDGGKVYVNGYIFADIAGIKSLGDSSWGIVFGKPPRKHRNIFVEWLIKLYDAWLSEVYDKCVYLGLIEVVQFQSISIWHLIFDNLPKGEIVSKFRLPLDNQYTS